MIQRAIRSALLLTACVFLVAVPRVISYTQATPASIADELLAADRAFLAASAKTDLVSGFSAMFADDIVMAIPGTSFAEGRTAVVAALQANPANLMAKAEWEPVRAGISADGLQGFTFGYMTIRRADGTTVPAKYMSYWVKGPQGWRVVAYKRGGSPAEGERTPLMAPSLPVRLVPPSTDAQVIAAHRASLDAAERAFSADAQVMGIGAAFTKHGHDDAVNMNRPTVAFQISAAEIGKGSKPGTTSPVTWAPMILIVSSSGDLGVSLGRSYKNAADGTPTTEINQTFFTIWRRDSPTSPWKYIAE